MRLSSLFTRLSSLSLSLFFGLAVFAIQPFTSSSEALAESYQYRAVYAGKRHKVSSAGVNRVGIARSGVRFGKKKHFNKHKHFAKQKHHIRKNHSNYYIKKRKREIARRNAHVRNHNDLRRLRASTRRTGSNGRFLTRNERISILNGDPIGPEIITVTKSSQYRASSGCPSGHNCGYRIYSDGTGPRIITPGVQLGNDLPDYDGLNGPKIITLD